MSKTELRSVSTELRVATLEDGTRTISGFIPYNSESVDLGGFTEVIAPGAFSGALAASSDVLALRDHDQKLLLGRTKSGTLSLSDAADGLRYTVELPNTTAAADLAESVSRGDLDSTSFGFVTREDKWVVTSDKVVRTLLSVDLMEVSPCSFAAYPDSAVAIRSCPDDVRSKLEKRDEQCSCACAECRAGNCADCSDPDCDDDNCDCEDDDDLEADSTRSYMEMTLALRERGLR